MAMETVFFIEVLYNCTFKLHKAPKHDAKHVMMIMDQMHITPQDAIDAQPNLVHLNIFDGQLCKRILVD